MARRTFPSECRCRCRERRRSSRVTLRPLRRRSFRYSVKFDFVLDPAEQARRLLLGGALALAYATHEPRGTRDIDVNVFVASTEAQAVFAALPAGVAFTDAHVADAGTRHQVRL